MHQKFFHNYFLIFFSLIPISILVGPSVSLGNILLICFLGLITLTIVYRQKYNFFSTYPVKLLIFLYLYLIFNSFIALDFEASATRNFGFIRFIILFILCNYFFYLYPKSQNIFKFWLLILLVVIFDVFYEAINGTNILGYGEDYGSRIISFFRTEPVVGFYIYSFLLLILGYFFNQYKNSSTYKKNAIIIFSILGFAAILITGERSNTIKCFLALAMFYFINHHFSYKKKLIFLITALLTFFISIQYVPFLEKRYKKQVYQVLSQKDQYWKLERNIYLNLYKSGYEVFKRYPLFGVGNKNYRVETCDPENIKKFGKEAGGDYLCITHPHQIYFEFLSEHGLIGSAILLVIFFNLIFRKLKIIILSKNYIQVGCFIYLVINFIPLLPSGSFFADFKSTMFWLNLSIMYSVSKDTNIFYLFDKNHNFTKHK